MKLAVFVLLSLAIGFVLGTVVHPSSVKAQTSARVYITEATPGAGMTLAVARGEVVGFSCVYTEDGAHCFVASK